jgi:hypothetical protein
MGCVTFMGMGLVTVTGHGLCIYCSGLVEHKGMSRIMFISKLPVKQAFTFNFAINTDKFN